MANDKKMVEAITSMDVDFAQWYTDVVKKAELCDYASVKGCMVTYICPCSFPKGFLRKRRTMWRGLHRRWRG